MAGQSEFGIPFPAGNGNVSNQPVIAYCEESQWADHWEMPKKWRVIVQSLWATPSLALERRRSLTHKQSIAATLMRWSASSEKSDWVVRLHLQQFGNCGVSEAGSSSRREQGWEKFQECCPCNGIIEKRVDLSENPKSLNLKHNRRSASGCKLIHI